MEIILVKTNKKKVERNEDETFQFFLCKIAKDCIKASVFSDHERFLLFLKINVFRKKWGFVSEHVNIVVT